MSYMKLELQKQHEGMDVPPILTHLHKMYDTCEIAKRYEVLNELYNCNILERGQVGPYMVKMIGYIEWLAS